GNVLPDSATVADAAASENPYLIIDSGVASVAASTPGDTKSDIIVGHEVNNIALAANAGFIKFEPNPPKNCLTIIIAKAEPTTGIHHGAVGGKLKANSIPVITALKSFIAIGLPKTF